MSLPEFGIVRGEAGERQSAEAQRGLAIRVTAEEIPSSTGKRFEPPRPSHVTDAGASLMKKSSTVENDSAAEIDASQTGIYARECARNDRVNYSDVHSEASAPVSQRPFADRNSPCSSVGITR